MRQRDADQEEKEQQREGEENCALITLRTD